MKPVSQASRSAQGGTYSFWYSSARGTMKPSRPRRANSARSAATRGAVAPGSLAVIERLEMRLEHAEQCKSKWEQVGVGRTVIFVRKTERAA